MARKILLKNNEIFAEAAIRCGVRYYFGYPITPQNEITNYMANELPKVEGHFFQPESELGAINTLAGCASAGKLPMVSTSGPGISLMSEGLSFLACAELPCLILNVMRVGPGDGDIRGSQGDYFQAVKGGGHGDYKVIEDLKAAGYQVILSIGEVEENRIGSNCGQYVMKHLSDARKMRDGYTYQVESNSVINANASGG